MNQAALALPVTLRLPSVPTLVMLVWLAVCSVPVIVLADIPLVTFSDPNVPTLVMLVWLAVCIVPVSVLPELPIEPAFTVGADIVPWLVSAPVVVTVVNAPVLAVLAPIAPVR